MAYKRKNKRKTRANPLNHTKKYLKRKIPSPRTLIIRKRYTRASNNISILPDDVLLKIFSFFTTDELFFNLRLVCKRWKNLAMQPTLWKEIVASPLLPTNTLLNWIKSAPLLNSFAIENRNDTNVIAEELSKSCKHLESIKMQNCWGSTSNCLIQSGPLCNLVTRCSKLYNYNFSQSRFISKKFFRLISRDQKNGKTMKKCSYIGPMTCKQMRALFAALKDYEVQDTATIGNVNFNHRFKLRDIIRSLEEVQNPRHVLWDNFNYGHEVIEIPIEHLNRF
ncbi:S-phase kinase-associated protein 2-like [Onthophagus taurus]|uniref:S-phase kinase-associated protein 2-like n=1 Tax=Onthophagus taurus TaxID=166361 RepID=UPI0039BECB9A